VGAAREAGRLVAEGRRADGDDADGVDPGARRATDLFDWQDDA
jgi:hypothetical protein